MLLQTPLFLLTCYLVGTDTVTSLFDSLAQKKNAAQSWKHEGDAAWFPAGQLASHRKPAEEAEGRAPAALGAGARCRVGGAARCGGGGHRVGVRPEAGGLG